MVIVLVVPVVCFERFMATVLVQDYEKKRRPMIGILPILLTEFVGTILAILLTLTYITDQQLAAIVIFVQLISCAVFYLIRHVTKQLDRKCETNNQFYTLSIKYQIFETYRLMKLIQLLVSQVIILITILAFAVWLYSSQKLTTMQGIYMAIIVEAVAHINPIFICSSAMFSIPQWPQRILECLPGRTRASKISANILEKKLDPGARSQLYFEHLKNSW
ncbi:unnamed protein product [Caenorhabditis angaria]|uniref:G protein-coupled receptor n=1 Tax=Caenorhabditis angaria TaxID=860376 RepID=A0A9P1MUH5_9PELO|nr:unnamed protein product [Caenorhabditis angaria]